MNRDYVTINRDVWNADAPNEVARAEYAWARDTPVWGSWAIPEESLNMLPADLTGQDAIELGCGTGYVSCWMARRARHGDRRVGQPAGDGAAAGERTRPGHHLHRRQRRDHGAGGCVFRFRDLRIRCGNLVRARQVAARGLAPFAPRRAAGVSRQSPDGADLLADQRRAHRKDAAPTLSRHVGRGLDHGRIRSDRRVLQPDDFRHGWPCSPRSGSSSKTIRKSSRPSSKPKRARSCPPTGPRTIRWSRSGTSTNRHDRFRTDRRALRFSSPCFRGRQRRGSGAAGVRCASVPAAWCCAGKAQTPSFILPLQAGGGGLWGRPRAPGSAVGDGAAVEVCVRGANAPTGAGCGDHHLVGHRRAVSRCMRLTCKNKSLHGRVRP